MEIEWVNGFEIKSSAENNTIVISANKEGMLSLAKQLTMLADGAPTLVPDTNVVNPRST